MNSVKKEEQCLFRLLAASLQTEPDLTELISWIEHETPDFEQVISQAKKHKVVSFLYPILEKIPACADITSNIQQNVQMTVSQNYRLLFLDKFLLEELTKAGIFVVVLKGMATACLYPQPELRKSGDVDLLLLDISKLDAAIRCMEELGFRVAEEQLALHHVVFESEENLEIELHTCLAEPFDNEKTNRYLAQLHEKCKDHVTKKEFLNVELFQLDVPFHAYELLLHMLQHFLRSGFGLKLLCDWVVFWNQETTKEEQRQYLSLVNESGLKGFSDMITAVCCHNLGLDEKKVSFMEISQLAEHKISKEEEAFLQEIMEAEEFGKTSNARMVALRGNGFWDYVREFHHQMRLNFPKAGKCFLLWPILWSITLIRFLINNRRIRKVSVGEVLRKAGQRGKIIENLHLFEQDEKMR